MALSAEDIEQIAAILSAAETAARAHAEVRALFPKLSLTRVDSSDLGMAEPFQRHPQFDLYLVDGSGHCWSLTDNPEFATGLVIAARASMP